MPSADGSKPRARQKPDWRIDANYSTSLGRVDNRNSTAPVSGTLDQDNTATAKRWPAFEDTLYTAHMMGASLT